MKTLSIYLIALSILPTAFSEPVTPASTAWSISSKTIAGKSVVAKVLMGDLNSKSLWKGISVEPPLSPRDAVQKAELYAQEFCSDGLKIEVGDVTLKNIGISQYVYVVQFYFVPANGKMDGFSPPLNVVVLMDGRVVQFSDDK